jgi:peroxiredoxin
MLIPRQRVPDLSLPLLGGGRFDLAGERADWGTVVCFYRGLHCPICATYLADLDKRTPAFAEKGLTTIAVSSDGAERTQAMADKIDARNLRFGYDLALSDARDWGLYISTSRGKSSVGVEEPALFSEPGLFIVKPDLSLYYGAVQTMPFARPHFGELVAALDFVQKNDYPARGEYVGKLEDVSAA